MGNNMSFYKQCRDTVSLESGDVDFDSLNEWESDDSEINDDEGPPPMPQNQVNLNKI